MINYGLIMNHDSTQKLQLVGRSLSPGNNFYPKLRMAQAPIISNSIGWKDNRIHN
jgi:hypothetical protein